jgi:hypothetical protein
MRRLFRAIPFLLIFVGAMLLSEREAWAYADPGTGLLAIQAAGSALIAAGWYMRRKLFALFHRGVEDAGQPDEPPAANQDESSSPR